MTKIHETGRAWELVMSKRFGEAVVRRRKALGLSATQLWERTKVLDYPVTRVAISKIENNARNGKLEVAEVFALAAALEIPPSLLLFPDYPVGEVEVIPGRMATSEDAALWISGGAGLPSLEGGARGPGVELVGAVDDLRARRRELEARRLDLLRRSGDGDADARTLLALYDREIHYLALRIESERTALWGGDA